MKNELIKYLEEKQKQIEIDLKSPYGKSMYWFLTGQKQLLQQLIEHIKYGTI